MQQEYCEKMQQGDLREFVDSDREFVERFQHFAFGEVPSMKVPDGWEPIGDRTRHMAILAVLLGCQGIDEYGKMVEAALNYGVTPVEIKEIVYQAVDYLGIGRVYPFIKATNDTFEKLNVKLPDEPRATTDIAAEDDGSDMRSRRVAGTQAQVEIFGDGMKEFWKGGQVNYWLAENCFGDYYTRQGLSLKDRELVTFCYIYAQGGCEPQLTGHTAGNFRMGNDKSVMTQVVLHCIPFIGYPRTLNALAVINKVAEEQEGK